MNFKVRVVTVVIVVIISLLVVINHLQDDQGQKSRLKTRKPVIKRPKHHENGHKLCLLVPFRDRFDELVTFVPWISKFLRGQNVDFTILVINQQDSFRFNRASLINVGFNFAISPNYGCDYIGLHDVDLLPNNDLLNYSFPAEKTAFHVSPPGLHPKYDYPNFIGGIMLLRSEDFEDLNGMSNNFWGWGLEDDEFFARLREAKMSIDRPPSDLKTGKEATFKHAHSSTKRKRDYRKCYNQRDMTKRRDRITGFKDVKFRLKSKIDLTFDGFEAVLINVFLECDREKTPYCDCSNAPREEAPNLPVAPEDNILPYLPKRN